MPRELHLHIGTPKTGTTSLQILLRSNREILSAKGYLYPEAVGPGSIRHRYLYTFSKESNEINNNLLTKLGSKNLQELEESSKNWINDVCSKKNNSKKVIMSDENLSNCNRNEIKKLHNILNSKFKKITVHLTIRNHSDLMISEYKQRISASLCPDSFPAFCRNKYKNRMFRFYEILNDYSNIFGIENISAYIYKANPNGSNLSILKNIGVDNIIQDFNDFNLNKSYESLNTINLKLELNGLIKKGLLKVSERDDKKKPNKIITKFINDISPLYLNKRRTKSSNLKIDETILGIWNKDWRKTIEGKFKNCFRNID